MCTGGEESGGTLAHTRTTFSLTDTPLCTLSCWNSLHACRQKFSQEFRDFRAVAKMGTIFCTSKTVEVKVSQGHRACWQGAWDSHSQDTQSSSLQFSRINSPHNHTSSVKEKNVTFFHRYWKYRGNKPSVYCSYSNESLSNSRWRQVYMWKISK